MPYARRRSARAFSTTQAVASPLASIAQAEGDRYGFIASVRRASSSDYEHGDRILRIDRRYRFLSAHGDRYGFIAGVTREEFEVQRAVLLRSREKIDALERAVQVLEARLATPDTSRN